MQHDRRDAIVPCAVQPRDVAIVRDVWRYKFLTAPQLLELWWPDGARVARTASSPKALQRRLPRAVPPARSPGLLSVDVPPGRRRPPAPSARRRRRAGTAVLRAHDLRLRPRPARAPAQRLGAGVPTRSRRTRSSHGTARPTSRHHAMHGRRQLRLDGDWSAEGLRDRRRRLLRPDAVLELARRRLRTPYAPSWSSTTGPGASTRTTTSSAATTPSCAGGGATPPYADAPAPPFVLFVCQTEEQRQHFIAAADHELTGHHLASERSAEHHDYVGRRRAALRRRARRARRNTRGLAASPASPGPSSPQPGCAARLAERCAAASEDAAFVSSAATALTAPNETPDSAAVYRQPKAPSHAHPSRQGAVRYRTTRPRRNVCSDATPRDRLGGSWVSGRLRARTQQPRRGLGSVDELGQLPGKLAATRHRGICRRSVDLRVGQPIGESLASAVTNRRVSVVARSRDRW